MACTQETAMINSKIFVLTEGVTQRYSANKVVCKLCKMHLRTPNEYKPYFSHSYIKENNDIRGC